MLRRLKQQKNKKPFNYKVVNNKLYLLGEGEDKDNNVLNLSVKDNLRYLSYDLINKIYYNAYSISPLKYEDFKYCLNTDCFKIYCLVNNNIYEYYDFLVELLDMRWKEEDEEQEDIQKLMIYYDENETKELIIDIENNKATYKVQNEDDIIYNFSITNIVMDNDYILKYTEKDSTENYNYFKFYQIIQNLLY